MIDFRLDLGFTNTVVNWSRRHVHRVIEWIFLIWSDTCLVHCGYSTCGSPVLSGVSSRVSLAVECLLLEQSDNEVRADHSNCEIWIVDDWNVCVSELKSNLNLSHCSYAWESYWISLHQHLGSQVRVYMWHGMSQERNLFGSQCSIVKGLVE